MGSKYVSDYDRKPSAINPTWIVLALLVLFLGVLGFLAYRGKLSGDDGSKQNSVAGLTTSAPASGTNVVSGSSDSVSRKGQLPAEPTVNPAKKVVMGIAQLAPSGLYLYAFETDGVNHRLIDKKLQKELIHEGFFPSSDELKKGLKSYIDDMFNKDGVTNKRYVQFVTSSGAMKYTEIQNAVKALEDGGNGYIVTKTNVEMEGRYALEATLSKEQRENSFIGDLTPSVTRLSWYENGKPKTIELPGSKYYQDDVSGDQAKSALSDDQAKAVIIDKLKELPLKNRENGVIIWAAGDGLKKDSARYAFLEDSYKTDDKLLLNGLKILYAVREQTGSPLYFDFQTSYVIGFGKSFFRPS